MDEVFETNTDLEDLRHLYGMLCGSHRSDRYV
jgi:hypothetical protein